MVFDTFSAAKDQVNSLLWPMMDAVSMALFLLHCSVVGFGSVMERMGTVLDFVL